MSGLTDDELVDELAEVEEGLSEWEVEFVDDLAKRLHCARQLTGARGDAASWLTHTQRQKALEIYEERVHGRP